MKDTYREIISDVTGSLRSLNIDDRISRRLILSILEDKAKNLIKQDADSRRLLKTTDMWLSIDCIDLCPIPPTSCGDIGECKVLMRSKKQLPEVYETNYGDLIKIMTIEYGKEYTQIRLFDYKDIRNREYKDPGKRYFWILDHYLYIPDSEVRTVFGIGLFRNPYEVDKFKGIEDCKAFLDYVFPCPDYLLDVVKSETKKELAEIYKRIVPDEKPDLDVNIKE